MCTSIFLISKDGSHVLARTMDWPRLAVSPLFIPRGYQWRSVFDRRLYTNSYALIGGGSITSRVDVSDGVNEWGLMAQKLTFANGAAFATVKRADKVQLAAFEFVFWLLGRFKSVADLEAHLPEVQLMADTQSLTKYGKPELHFAVADRTGRSVVIEPTQTPLRVIENPLGVVTNSPHFEDQLQRLGRYVEFTPAFIAGQVPLNTPKVTTGNLAGKAVPPGSYTPGARFVRAAYNKERADQPLDEADAIVTSWRLLDGVSVPHSSDHQQTFSVYRAAAAAESRSYYFQAYHQANVVKVQLTDAMLKWTEPKRWRQDDIFRPETLN